MHMSASGGFILTGVKVNKRDDGWKFVEKNASSTLLEGAAKKAKVEATDKP